MTLDIDADLAAFNRIDVVGSILDVLCRTTGMGFAKVTRVTAGRWMACAVHDDIEFAYDPLDAFPGENATFDTLTNARRPVVIECVDDDPDYFNHPIPAKYKFQSFISVPVILPDGSVFGTLCSLDPRPAQINQPHVIQMFTLFADVIGMHVATQRRIIDNEQAMVNQMQAAERRTKFIGLLAHDVRNQITALNAGVRLLRRESLEGRAPLLLDLMDAGVTQLSTIVDNVTDLISARIGSGITADRIVETALGDTLEQTVIETRAAWPNRTVNASIAVTAPVLCDRARMAQLLSNLLNNALRYGAEDQPVEVHAATSDDALTLYVANKGAAMPAEVIARLFRPFVRGEGNDGDAGLGLGLFIAAEIAGVHGGTLDVSSTAEETRFTLRMPLR